MKRNVFDFKAQMEVGEAGETEFASLYGSLSPKKSEDRAYDFVLSNGQKVELKTDTYPMESTENFFMEKLSDLKSGKLGGPWRAKQDNVNVFVYYYVNDKRFFWFEPVALVERIEKLIQEQKLRPIYVRNKGWTATGYKIKRADVFDLLIKDDDFRTGGRKALSEKEEDGRESNPF